LHVAARRPLNATRGIEDGRLTRPRLSRFQAAGAFFPEPAARKCVYGVHHPRTPRNERNFALKKLGVGQQVPKPPAPEPGVPPGNLPPLPPAEIPVPDPAPPPIEDPGDAPLPPITDPDVIEPGEPKPAHTPMRVRGVKRSPRGPAARSSALKGGEESRHERSNSFPSSALQHAVMEANLGISRIPAAPSRARPRITVTLKTGVELDT
jgi:hypothetical protein